jgi:hypothetical protein
MATWNVGPFDNDDAVEWCDRFAATAPEHRTAEIERTLRQAATNDAIAAEVVAAAAVLCQAHTGLPDATTRYAPRFVTGSDDVIASSELLRLAKTALEAVMCEESSWRLRWADDVEGELAVEGLERLYAALGDTTD